MQPRWINPNRRNGPPVRPGNTRLSLISSLNNRFSREFSELFSLLAYLVLQVDTSPHLSHVRPDTEAGPGPRELMAMPGPVSRLLYGPLAVTYIAETISASREMNTSSLSLIIEMLVKVIEFALTED